MGKVFFSFFNGQDSVFFYTSTYVLYTPRLIPLSLHLSVRLSVCHRPLALKQSIITLKAG